MLLMIYQVTQVTIVVVGLIVLLLRVDRAVVEHDLGKHNFALAAV